jgi:hypothetical protein
VNYFPGNNGAVYEVSLEKWKSNAAKKSWGEEDLESSLMVFGVQIAYQWPFKRLQIMTLESNKKEEEARGEEALLKLKHPNVVQIYHAESDKDFR